MFSINRPRFTPILQELIASEQAYLIRVSDGSRTPIYGTTEDLEFIIADEEGLRKTVEAHPENCDCGVTTEYIFPLALMHQARNAELTRVYEIDQEILEAHRNLLMGEVKPAYTVGDYAEYKNEAFIGRDSNRFDYPPEGSLVLVTHYRYDSDEGCHVIIGYTAVQGKVIRVSSEAWRFSKYEAA